VIVDARDELRELMADAVVPPEIAAAPSRTPSTHKRR
jgi:hypothetical protein